MLGAEGATQVVGLIGDWVGSLPTPVRNKLKVWMYDDMCHLGRDQLSLALEYVKFHLFFSLIR